MSRLLTKLAITIAVAGLLCNPIAAQILPPQKRAQHVEITKGPELELAHDDMAIVRWTTTIDPARVDLKHMTLEPDRRHEAH